MPVDFLRELLQHERQCHASLVDAEKHAANNRKPEERARERWSVANDWINYFVSRELLREDASDGWS